ncbi:FecR family protein [Tamlana haliotis]|uniref:FecR family protein n=1 Tax=Pseudotamlana haliotis TaxID=2614804 RepID=A0A6N6MD69_9FLAO|nr:FecR domain-containing protein [Tamlana haliotis]KAB1068154.1 FecR family protein [Tamlana haliotis]
MINNDIENLIIRYCSNQISSDELNILNNWLNESENNKLVFKHYVSVNYNIEQYQTVNLSNLDVTWSGIESKIKKEKRKPAYWKYAVAASIVLFISLSIAYVKTQVHEQLPNQITTNPPVIIDNTIEAGTNRAVLTLEDGSSVILEDGKDFVSNNLSANGEHVLYSNSKVSKEEVKYNFLTVPRGGQFFIKLPDGTKAWLNSESQLKYPIAFVEGEPRKVELVYGEAYFEVSSSTEHHGARFIVGTHAQEVEVLGTKFNIEAYKGETNIYTTLAEGRVSVSNMFDNTILKEGEQSKINVKIQNSIIEVASVDVEKVISWKNGIFSFRNETLGEIAKVLSRWYDVDIVFLNHDLEDIRFNGVSRKNQNIEEILLNIKHTKFINSYEINGKTIIIK